MAWPGLGKGPSPSSLVTNVAATAAKATFKLVGGVDSSAMCKRLVLKSGPSVP
jgi:hypothetical protein